MPTAIKCNADACLLSVWILPSTEAKDELVLIASSVVHKKQFQGTSWLFEVAERHIGRQLADPNDRADNSEHLRRVCLRHRLFPKKTNVCQTV